LIVGVHRRTEERSRLVDVAVPTENDAPRALLADASRRPTGESGTFYQVPHIRLAAYSRRSFNGRLDQHVCRSAMPLSDAPLGMTHVV
jgi:hypothetical protein